MGRLVFSLLSGVEHRAVSFGHDASSWSRTDYYCGSALLLALRGRRLE
jgi:hypothetical protein